jgi:hypothetical protein
MKQRLLFGLLFFLLLVAAGIVLHRLPQITIYTNQTHATVRIIAFAACLAVMILSWPRWLSGKISLLLCVVLFAELLMFFRPIPVDASGIGEPSRWFFPMWFYVNLANIVIIPTAIGLLVYDYLNEEKTTYIVAAAAYLVLLGTLFPFEQICRWGTYALM